MAFLEHAFDVNELPVSDTNYEVLPEGWYNTRITEAKIKATKKGDGQYFAVRYDIIGPSHQGRVVFGNINIKNSSPKAEEIGRQQLGSLMRAIGLTRVTDTDQLISGTLQIKLSVKQDETYGDKNEIKGFKAVSTGSMPGVIAAHVAVGESQATVQQSAPAAASVPPWAAKR